MSTKKAFLLLLFFEIEREGGIPPATRRRLAGDSRGPPTPPHRRNSSWHLLPHCPFPKGGGGKGDRPTTTNRHRHRRTAATDALTHSPRPHTRGAARGRRRCVKGEFVSRGGEKATPPPALSSVSCMSDQERRRLRGAS